MRKYILYLTVILSLLVQQDAWALGRMEPSPGYETVYHDICPMPDISVLLFFCAASFLLGYISLAFKATVSKKTRSIYYSTWIGFWLIAGIVLSKYRLVLGNIFNIQLGIDMGSRPDVRHLPQGLIIFVFAISFPAFFVILDQILNGFFSSEKKGFKRLHFSLLNILVDVVGGIIIAAFIFFVIVMTSSDYTSYEQCATLERVKK